jgi:hypothetical protein
MAMSDPPNSEGTGSDASATDGTTEANAWRRVRERRAPPPLAADPRAIPDSVRTRFRGDGDRYHFPDGAWAFTDRGGELATPSNNGAVIRAFVEISAARGWTAIELRGSERFRREAWAEAMAAGIAVSGPEPAGVERDKSPRPPEALEADVNPRTKGRAKTDRETVWNGRLLEHGAARYQHREDADQSYFVTLATPGGPRTVWGIDLERAIRESETHPEIGDAVEVSRTGRRAVTVKTRVQNAAGEWVPAEKITHRNAWIVEKAGFLAQRAAAAAIVRDADLSPTKAMARHPELAGTAAQLKVAQDVAARAPLQESDRARFVAGVREALAGEIARGAPWPQAKVRMPIQRMYVPPERAEELSR